MQSRVINLCALNAKRSEQYGAQKDFHFDEPIGLKLYPQKLHRTFNLFPVCVCDILNGLHNHHRTYIYESI